MIVFETRYDQLTRQSAHNIIEWCENRGAYLRFVDAIDLATPNTTTTLEDVVQYAIDVLNDATPIGHWYYLTADANIEFDGEGDDQ